MGNREIGSLGDISEVQGPLNITQEIRPGSIWNSLSSKSLVSKFSVMIWSSILPNIPAKSIRNSNDGDQADNNNNNNTK